MNGEPPQPTEPVTGRPRVRRLRKARIRPPPRNATRPRAADGVIAPPLQTWSSGVARGRSGIGSSSAERRSTARPRQACDERGPSASRLPPQTSAPPVDENRVYRRDPGWGRLPPSIPSLRPKARRVWHRHANRECRRRRPEPGAIAQPDPGRIWRASTRPRDMPPETSRRRASFSRPSGVRASRQPDRASRPLVRERGGPREPRLRMAARSWR